MKRKYQKDRTIAMRLLGMAQAPKPGANIDWHHVTIAAYERLRDGGGTKDDFDVVAEQMNCARVRAEKIHPRALALIMDAQAAMTRMKGRYLKGLTLGFDAEGLIVMPAALDAWEQIADGSTKLQMRAALKESYRRVTGRKLRI